MSRRPDPELVKTARPEATAGQLRDVGLPSVTVDAWLEAWEARDPDPIAGDYWQRGDASIAGAVAAGRKPLTG